MERHSEYILRSIMKTAVSSSVEEVLQRTYIKCWQKIRTFKFKSSFRTWIYAVLRNNHYDLARKEMRQRKFEIPFCEFVNEEDSEKNPLDFIQGNSILFFNDELPSSNLEQQERAEYLKRLFKKVKKKLNPSQKRTMELVLENDMSYQEAASEMCCSVGTVMSRLFYARKAAQKVIKEHYEKV